MRLDPETHRGPLRWSVIGFAAGAALTSFLAAGNLTARIEFMMKIGAVCGLLGGLAAFLYASYRRNP